jgi:hypothetical protein
VSATWYGLIEVLAGVPNLNGAACATGKRYELFDIEDPDDERAEAARNICGSCSARPECVSWFASLPKGNTRPAGTIAGRTYERPKLAPPRVRAELQGDISALKKTMTSRSSPRSPRPRPDAAAWLADRLAAGPVLAADVVADGIKAGLSPSTLDRARRSLGAVSDRLPGRRGASQWRLDADCARHGRAVPSETPSGAA